jgi:hypothetical protein
VGKFYGLSSELFSGLATSTTGEFGLTMLLIHRYVGIYVPIETAPVEGF